MQSFIIDRFYGFILTLFIGIFLIKKREQLFNQLRFPFGIKNKSVSKRCIENTILFLTTLFFITSLFFYSKFFIPYLLEKFPVVLIL